MLLLVVKWIHILGAVVFLGTGGGSAYYKLRAFLSGDVRVVAWCDAEIVRADWWFTVPSGVLVPITGASLVELYGYPWTTGWVLWALGGYVAAGLFWVPAALLQIRMRRQAEASLARGEPLPASYAKAQRAWALLGIPSFGATVFVVWLMVAKWAAIH